MEINKTIFKITMTEEAIKTTFQRLEVLQKRLNESVPDEKAKMIRTELEEVRKLLKTHEAQLAHLRTHNRKTFIFVVALIFVIFSIYSFYILVLMP